MTLEELRAVAEIVEKLTNRYRDQEAAHKAALTEIRASFNARTIADGKRHEGILDTYRSALDTIDAALNPAREESTASVAKRLVEERDGLLTQVQDMRAEIKQRAKEQDQDHKTIVSLMSERDGLRVQVQDMREEIIRVNDAHGQTLVERDALRAEVAALQEGLRASIARGDFAQMEVAALKSQDPAKVGAWVRRTDEGYPDAPTGYMAQVLLVKYRVRDQSGSMVTWSSSFCEPCKPPQTEPAPKRAHPVAVGGYLRRLTGFNTTPAGEVARVTLVDGDDASQLEYEVVRPNGQKGRWSAKGCEPCDPPEATAKPAPKVGDTVRLVTHPERAQVAKHLRHALQWPWMPSWGLVGQTGKVVKPLVAVAGAVAVAPDGSTIFARWPIDCLEVVTEATHDTEAGKAAAESALKTEPVAEEIKVGDLVEVFQATGSMTDAEDIGSGGVVHMVDGLWAWLDRHYTMGLPRQGVVSLSDVRKVTT